MAERWGFEGELYYGTVATEPASGLPASTLLTGIVSVQIQSTKDEGDFSSRDDYVTPGIAPIKKLKGGWRTIKATINMKHDSANAGLALLREVNAGLNKRIGLRFLDVESGEGQEGDFDVLDISKGEPIAEMQTVDVELSYVDNHAEV